MVFVVLNIICEFLIWVKRLFVFVIMRYWVEFGDFV